MAAGGKASRSEKIDSNEATKRVMGSGGDRFMRIIYWVIRGSGRNGCRVAGDVAGRHRHAPPPNGKNGTCERRPGRALDGFLFSVILGVAQ